MRFSRVILAALLLSAVPAGLMAQAGPKVNFAGAPAGSYAMDKNHANIIFRVNHLGFSLYPGRFNDFEAKLTLDPVHPEKSTVDATIDMASVDVHNTKLEEELKSADWFDATKYPTATFHATKLVKTGVDTGTMEGEFTMHGVTHPVTLNVLLHGYGEHPMSHKAHFGFGAVGTLKRSEWGVSKGVPMVGDDVTFQIEAEFDYAGAVAPSPPPPTPRAKP